jgi:hypothetical protein
MRPFRTLAILLAACGYMLAQQAPTSGVPAPSKPDAADSPPKPESFVTGWIDLGYRWVSDTGGSYDTYRSFINFGSGPKLLGTEFSLADPGHGLFDRLRVRANNLGGDPSQTIHVDANKSKRYDLSADYRDIAYFDILPSWADPLLSRGVALNERAYDTRRKMANVQLDLLPGKWIVPYLNWELNSGSGTGTTAFFTDANQFPVPTQLRDLTNLYRGGVRFEQRRFHVTLEQGGTTFKDDQQVFQNSGSPNYGNVSKPVLGQTTNLSGLLAAYGIRSTSIFTRGLFTAEPAPWLDLYGEFLYSQPKNDTNYQQNLSGNLLEFNPLLVYTRQSFLLSSAAKLPRTTGSYGFELRPASRVRVAANWMTDRLHNAGSAASSQVSGNTGAGQQTLEQLNSALVNNYNQVEMNLFYDATSKLMLRGGYRYVWGDASDSVLPPAGLVSADRGSLRRNVGLGGLKYQPVQKLSFTAEAEVGSSGANYFRTSLYNYQRVRAQARYQVLKSLTLTAAFSGLLNNNPTSGVDLDSQALQESLSLFWNPGKIWSLQGTYTRSTVHSDLGYLNPGTLEPQMSRYRDNAHTVTALFEIKPPMRYGVAPTITAGGSFFTSSGSRPTNYYQPAVRVRMPLGKQLAWFSEWRYYGYGEAFYNYEGFRTHMLITGLRLTR